ncbi:MAG: hypothetical protein NTX01_04100 [Candidatus Omnitrophica bacterium]|nr:hypothetical protein [Candidatus Omnitrophota bacterium]
MANKILNLFKKGRGDMLRRFGIVIVVLFISTSFTLKANAQQPASSGKPQGQGEGAQLRQEIASLEQQAKPLRAQLEQLGKQAKPIREQLHLIRKKLEADREKLKYLREERHEERKEHRQEMKQQNQAQQTSAVMPLQK